jgi:hypothetical protein
MQVAAFKSCQNPEVGHKQKPETHDKARQIAGRKVERLAKTMSTKQAEWHGGNIIVG